MDSNNRVSNVWSTVGAGKRIGGNVLRRFDGRHGEGVALFWLVRSGVAVSQRLQTSMPLARYTWQVAAAGQHRSQCASNSGTYQLYIYAAHSTITAEHAIIWLTIRRVSCVFSEKQALTYTYHRWLLYSDARGITAQTKGWNVNS